METQRRSPLRGRVGKIQNLGDLRRAGALLAGHLSLPRAPYIEVGDVSGGPIDVSLAGVGVFKIFRWAVRGDHRRSWDELEHMLVLGIGAWLESECRRRGSTFVGKGTSYALSIWYGEDVGRVLVERQARTARNYKRALIGLGLGFALLVMLSAIRVIK
jgi:hypothetical protein